MLTADALLLSPLGVGVSIFKNYKRQKDEKDVDHLDPEVRSRVRYVFSMIIYAARIP